jgi:ATP synthase subunit 6
LSLNFLYFSPLEVFEIDDFEWFGLGVNEAITSLLMGLLVVYGSNFVSDLDDTIDEEEGDDMEDDLWTELNDEIIADNLNDLDDEELTDVVSLIFGLILFGNFLNLVPVNDSNNNYLSYTLFMSSFIFFALNLNGIFTHKFSMVNLFLPQGVPSFLKPMLFVIEVISYFARLFSLGIRLFANMMSGHILVAILSTFVVILFLNISFSSFAAFFLIMVITAIYFLECIISYLQAYVFGMLVTIYYGDALNLHH